MCACPARPLECKGNVRKRRLARSDVSKLDLRMVEPSERPLEADRSRETLMLYPSPARRLRDTYEANMASRQIL